ISRACSCFAFHSTAPTHIYTLSLHDALPISAGSLRPFKGLSDHTVVRDRNWLRQSTSNCAVFNVNSRTRSREEEVASSATFDLRSEEHTSELQSRFDLVCRLLLEKKNNNHAI